MINRTILTGRLTADPELRYSQNGVGVASFTLAVNRPFDKEKTDFIRCICFKKTAENLANYQKKGSLIGVDGRIQTGSYEKDGRTIYTTDIVADQIVFLEYKKQSNQQNNPSRQQIDAANNEIKKQADPFAGSGEPIDISDDDLPF